MESSGPLREKEDKDPSVSVVSEKSLTKSDGDQLQAKGSICQYEPAFSKLNQNQEGVFFFFFFPTLHILMLSNGIAGTRPTSPIAPDTSAKKQKCIFSQQSKA